MPAVAFSVQSVQVSSGGTASDQFQLGRSLAIAVALPTLDSCSLHVAGATASGGPFKRLLASADGALFAAASGVGSYHLSLPRDVVGAWPFLRLETSAAQTDDRDFQVVIKL